MVQSPAPLSSVLYKVNAALLTNDDMRLLKLYPSLTLTINPNDPEEVKIWEIVVDKLAKQDLDSLDLMLTVLAETQDHVELGTLLHESASKKLYHAPNSFFAIEPDGTLLSVFNAIERLDTQPLNITDETAAKVSKVLQRKAHDLIDGHFRHEPDNTLRLLNNALDGVIESKALTKFLRTKRLVIANKLYERDADWTISLLSNEKECAISETEQTNRMLLLLALLPDYAIKQPDKTAALLEKTLTHSLLTPEAAERTAHFVSERTSLFFKTNPRKTYALIEAALDATEHAPPTQQILFEAALDGTNNPSPQRAALALPFLVSMLQKGNFPASLEKRGVHNALRWAEILGNEEPCEALAHAMSLLPFVESDKDLVDEGKNVLGFLIDASYAATPSQTLRTLAGSFDDASPLAPEVQTCLTDNFAFYAKDYAEQDPNGVHKLVERTLQRNKHRTEIAAVCRSFLTANPAPQDPRKEMTVQTFLAVHASFNGA